MRYQNLIAFEKHLKNASPSHLSPFYLILSKNESERVEWIRKVLAYLPGPQKFYQEISFAEFWQFISIPSFFSETIAGHFTERLKKEEQKNLLSFFKNCSFPVVLGFPDKDKIGLLDSFFEQEGVVLDLSSFGEKQRWREYVLQRAKEEKKHFEENALFRFFSFIEKDFSLLEKELEKLFLYVGEKHSIEEIDVLSICSSQEHFLWKIVEQIIWEEKPPQDLFPIDDQQFYSLLAMMRKQLRIGMQLLEGSKESFGLWPKLLQKRMEQAKKKSPTYYKKGLMTLFEIELLSKSSVSCYDSLLTKFFASLYSGSLSLT